jgi:hypothetical protein
VLALSEALSQREERELQRDAQLYALLCNLRGGGKNAKTWKAEDFFKPRRAGGKEDDEKARQALEAYRAWVGEGRG